MKSESVCTRELDVSIYANSLAVQLDADERDSSGVGEKLKVSLYTNPLFSHWQMKEIRLGLEVGLDVTSYAKLIFPERI